MDGTSKRRQIYKALATANFVIGIVFFLLTWIIIGAPLETSILTGILGMALFFSLSEIASRFTFHSIYLTPLRKRLLYMLSSIVIERWSVTLEITEDGSAVVTNEFWGRVNYGYGQWMTLGIWTGRKQPRGKRFKIRAFDVIRGVAQAPEFVLDESKYKRFRIRFGRTLSRGDKFHFKVQYPLLKTFFFDKEDYYAFDATHHAKEININVVFPRSIHVQYGGGEITSEHGELRPQFGEVEIANPQTIQWRIHGALHGDRHRLYWKAKKGF